MKHLMGIILGLGLLAAPPAGAFSLFSGDSSNTNKPPRLHVLLADANKFMEDGSDAANDGHPDQAIDCYKKALAELARVERENPARARTAEFAPLRNKAACCEAAIDRIRVAQVNATARAVAVTDTTELQRRYDQKHGITNAPSAKTPAAATNSLPGRTEAKKEEPAKAAAKAPPSDADAEKAARPFMEAARNAIGQGRFAAATTNLVAALRKAPDDWNARFLLAYVDVARQDYAAADLLFTDLLADRPKDIPTLLLHAGSQMATGNYLGAQKSLDAAIAANPRQYPAYYNMVLLLLEMDPKDVEVARKYYTIGRTVGGPRDADLERRLGMIKSAGGKQP